MVAHTGRWRIRDESRSPPHHGARRRGQRLRPRFIREITGGRRRRGEIQRPGEVLSGQDRPGPARWHLRKTPASNIPPRHFTTPGRSQHRTLPMTTGNARRGSRRASSARRTDRGRGRRAAAVACAKVIRSRPTTAAADAIIPGKSIETAVMIPTTLPTTMGSARRE